MLLLFLRSPKQRRTQEGHIPPESNEVPIQILNCSLEQKYGLNYHHSLEFSFLSSHIHSDFSTERNVTTIKTQLKMCCDQNEGLFNLGSHLFQNEHWSAYYRVWSAYYRELVKLKWYKPNPNIRSTLKYFSSLRNFIWLIACMLGGYPWPWTIPCVDIFDCVDGHLETPGLLHLQLIYWNGCVAARDVSWLRLQIW